ncbi:MAG TPA: tyrosine-type recombinase/integrase [Edaphobacter sp.]|nr:tyrosine-type recombinase/integrase [Edaphobacter sp.]
MPKKAKSTRDGIYTRKDRPGTKAVPIYWGSYIDGTGRRRQKKLGSYTLQAARDELAKLKADATSQRNTGIVPPSEDSFTKFAGEFLAYQKRRISSKVLKGKLSRTEYNRQVGIVEGHLNPYFGAMKLKLIQKQDVAAYINSRMGEVSDGTIIKEVNTLKRLLNVAIEMGKIQVNHAQRAPVPKAPEGRVRYLSPDELGNVLNFCPEWLRPIAGLAVALGTRRGELLAVRWEDINMNAGTILLRKTKNGKPRPAFINALARQVLVSMDTGKRRGLLFPEVTPAQVTVAFIRACKDAGIEDFSLHDLRHTFASHARMNGVDLHDLQKLLGHSDPRMTDRYAHLSNEHLANAARRLDGVLRLPAITSEAA